MNSLTDASTQIIGNFYFVNSSDEICGLDEMEQEFDKEIIESMKRDLSKGISEIPKMLQSADKIHKNFVFKYEDKLYEVASLFKDRKNTDTDLELLNSYVLACVKGCLLIDDPVWTTYETNLAQEEGLILAMSSKKYIETYIKIFETFDLDHEVDHGWELLEIIKKYGFCHETIPLWVARVGHCCGQHGHEEWNDSELSNWIAKDKSHEELVSNYIACSFLVGPDKKDLERANGKELVLNMIESDLDFFTNPDHGLGEYAETLGNSGLEKAKNLFETLGEDAVSKYWLDLFKQEYM